jgi:hypothetical protein
MSKQFSVVRNDHVEYAMWLTFDAQGGVRMSRGQPALGIGERALSLTAKLPLSIFRTPQFSATLTVNAGPEGGAPRIDVAAAEASMREALGVDVVLRVTGSEHQAEGATNGQPS